MSAEKSPERRKGIKDRRGPNPERRNEDRVAEDPIPRRHTEEPDRRTPDSKS